MVSYLKSAFGYGPKNESKNDDSDDLGELPPEDQMKFTHVESFSPDQLVKLLEQEIDEDAPGAFKKNMEIVAESKEAKRDAFVILKEDGETFLVKSNINLQEYEVRVERDEDAKKAKLINLPRELEQQAKSYSSTGIYKNPADSLKGMITVYMMSNREIKFEMPTSEEYQSSLN